MHLTPSDPDISTLIRKIEEDRLDLQPNFQRGEVWGKQKKQRLIDSILRGWHIPPVHVIQVPNSNKQEVLDGQQRLAAIRDFFRNEFPVVGNQEPLNKEILALDGKYYKDLDPITKGSIQDFTIRVLTISDYEVGEPGELFYRLNQPTNLTSAEQRNAYFGEARQQVKSLVEILLNFGFNTQTIGFSNSRMAYDDVIAKCLITVENRSLSTKITSNLVTSRYRDTEGFDPDLINSFENVIVSFKDTINKNPGKIRLNKATFYSWLLFYFEANYNVDAEQREIDYFFYTFEDLRSQSHNLELFSQILPHNVPSLLIKLLLEMFIDRASSRVSDISSVKIRDFTLWAVFLSYFPDYHNSNAQLSSLYKNLAHFDSYSITSEKEVMEILSSTNWDGLL